MRSIIEACLERAVVAAFAIVGLCGVGLTTASPSTNRSITEPKENTTAKSSYYVKLISLKPLRFSVSADIPIDGKTLDMDNTYPAELPQMAANGWPSLISNLNATDAKGKKVELTPAGTKGWQLASPMRALLHLSYEVDYSLFASNNWSSPLESAFVDDDDAIAAGRSMFITTAQTGAINVEISTPKGWDPVMPWPAETGISHRYHVKSREDLIDNMLVFSKNKPDLVVAAGFKMQIVSMGHWRPLRQLVRNALRTIISREVDLMGFKEAETYNVVLLPIADQGGEAYRQSFVYCFDEPDQTNEGIWANTLAHEIFHYWNYARLKGAKYESSQWFQEGFTEYVANLVTLEGKIIDPDAFIRKLSQHVNNYRKLTTTLENYGTHKGPPLYSAGALVAFMWDLEIRKASNGKRDIGDLFRDLMSQTDNGRRKYTWTDINAALQATADGDWEGFYQAHIKGHQPLPLDQLLQLAGLRLSKLADGTEMVSLDSDTSREAKALWNDYIGSHLITRSKAHAKRRKARSK